MRAEADPNAEVLAYLNNLSEVELLGEEKLVGNTLWQKVRAPDGKIGWIVVNRTFLISHDSAN